MYICMYVCMYEPCIYLRVFLFVFLRVPESEVGGPVRRWKELYLAILRFRKGVMYVGYVLMYVGYAMLCLQEKILRKCMYEGKRG